MGLILSRKASANFGLSSRILSAGMLRRSRSRVTSSPGEGAPARTAGGRQAAARGKRESLG
eukprot:2265768-Pyramimonas_sp.AAC.1